jgi:5-carboxymethyl-2-hydroxymuconate isomerase
VLMGRFARRVVSNFIGRAELVKLRSRAMRAGVWFRGLSRIDRAILDLTIRVAQSVHSASLARCILSVAEKLESLLESRVARLVREVGFKLACRLSSYAEKWGNKTAGEWSRDVGFARFLAVMRLNGHPPGGG